MNQPALELLVGGPADEARVAALTQALRQTAAAEVAIHRLPAFSSADALQRTVETLTAPFVAVFSGAALPRPTDSGLLLAAQQPGRVHLLLTAGLPDEARLWERIPQNIAALARPWDRLGGVILEKGRLLEQARSLPAARPLWRILTHAASEQALDVSAPPGGPEEIGDLPSLAPADPAEDPCGIRAAVRSLSAQEAGIPSQDAVRLACIRAGLLQLHDFLDESHQQAQSVEGRGKDRDGDYWHAIMHRREPDKSNSKYWFRRVGRHPVFAPLAGRAAELIEQAEDGGGETLRNRLMPSGDWEPFAFVDYCDDARRSPGSAADRLARRIQLVEMLLLLEHCLVSE